MSRPHKYPKVVSECSPHVWRELLEGTWACSECGARQPTRPLPAPQEPSQERVTCLHEAGAPGGVCPDCGQRPVPAGHDPVNRPAHYTQHPSGIECIQITEHMGFCTGNAMKYLWRADYKNGLEDLKKARWYIDREIAKREGQVNPA